MTLNDPFTAAQAAFVAFALEKGFKIPPPEPDGEVKRFDVDRNDLSGWYAFHAIPYKDRVIYRGVVGDNRKKDASGKSVKYTWRSGEFEPKTPEERAELEATIARAEAEIKAKREARAQQAAREAVQIWENAATQGAHPYIAKKGLPNGLYGCRLDPVDGQALLVPVRDCDGKLWGLQRIFPEKNEYGTDKLFTPGTSKKGRFHIVGGLGAGPVYVAEGLATSASVSLATGQACVVAFDAGNLEPVVQALRAKLGPTAKIIVAGDDDRNTPGNPGRTAAVAAARACGGRAVFPEGAGTDFNDMHVALGLDAVRSRLAPVAAATESNAPQDLLPWAGAPGAVQHDSKGKPKISQEHLVDTLLRHLNGRVIKQDRDLFQYTGTHWSLLTLGDHDKLKVALQRMCNGLADVRLIDAAYKLLIYNLPTPPPGVDLFRPNPFAANFLNGTLLVLKKGQQYEKFFKPHSPSDYLVNVLPYEYRAGDQTQNPEFRAMLDRVFEGDLDKDQRIRAVRQMYGACLIPAFPHLFMCWGQAGTGKSSVLMIAGRLVHKDNLCGVAPSHFDGFNMEGMLGKLVNIVRDIPFNAPLTEDIVKQIEDRGDFRIRRKGIKDVSAPLPGIHLFGGNGIPKTLDGGSGAHDRRWTFIQFSKTVAKGNYDKYYWDYCFEVCPQGVLNFALEGLDDLLASGGHYLNPDSGKAKMLTWQLDSDPVGRFLEELKTTGWKDDRNCHVIAGETLEMTRGDLWKLYVLWHKDSFNFPPRTGKHGFYDALRSKKVRESTTRGVDYFHGFGIVVGENAAH